MLNTKIKNILKATVTLSCLLIFFISIILYSIGMNLEYLVWTCGFGFVSFTCLVVYFLIPNEKELPKKTKKNVR
jgi:hypothetical protein